MEPDCFTPDGLLRVIDRSAQPPGRLAPLALPAGQDVPGLLRAEGPAALRERMAHAPTVAELLGL